MAQIPFFLFRSGALQGAAPIVVIDTHDGEPRRKYYQRKREEVEELRQQIIWAFESKLGGPDFEEALEAVAAPGPAPVYERIDFELGLASQDMRAKLRVILDELEDEEVILLLQ